MTFVHTVTARAIETAILARVRVDASTSGALDQLQNRTIQLDIANETFYLEFDNRHASVKATSSHEPDLIVRGAFVDVVQALVSKNTDGVALMGDEALMPILQSIFHPDLRIDDLAESARATIEMGVTTVRSVLEGLASEITSSSREKQEIQQKIDSLEEEMRNLREEIAKLKQQDSSTSST